MRISRVATAFASAVLLVTVGACNSGTSPTSTAPEDDTASSPAAEPSESPSEEPSEEPEEKSGGYSAEELISAMQDAVAENRSAHISMTMKEKGGQTLTAEGDVSYEGQATAMQWAMEAPQLGGSMEIRLVDEFVYLSVPPLTPPGKFMKIDVNDTTSPFGDLSSMTENDPRSTFDEFEAGLEDVKYVGEEEVDGETLHHYVLTVDAKKAAKAQGQTAPKGVKKITYDLWIDDEDQMRRMDFKEGGATMSMRMDKWGEPVDVEAPPKSAIVKTPELPGVPAQP